MQEDLVLNITVNTRLQLTSDDRIQKINTENLKSVADVTYRLKKVAY